MQMQKFSFSPNLSAVAVSSDRQHSRTSTMFSFFLLPFLLLFFTWGCKKKDSSTPTLATVSAVTIGTVGANSVELSSGISSDGNSTIVAVGFCLSETQTSPSIENADTVIVSSLSGSVFSSSVTGLTSSTTYFVRAYATNSIGTSYGAIVDFTSGNAAPTVSDVEITGNLEIGSILTAAYLYDDAENDMEIGTTFKWYSAVDAIGTGETVIENATNKTYTILATDEFKFIRVGITPKAASGTTEGIEMKSFFSGPVPEAPETVTFPYNGENVTFGVIISSVTGRKWLDRNLGASRVALTPDDYQAFGDLFQWGRLADGHQLIIWTKPGEDIIGTPVNGITTTQSISDIPNNSLFIYYSSSATDPNTVDWRTPQNNNLWQAPQYTNNPCPSGWHVPTSAEWNLENMSSISDAFNKLKLTASGDRRHDTGLVNNDVTVGWGGYYWSSTPSTAFTIFANSPRFLPEEITGSGMYEYGRRMVGYSCRCIKNQDPE